MCLPLLVINYSPRSSCVAEGYRSESRRKLLSDKSSEDRL
jgi:hypothetical protein